jgi:hypothetical protein
MKLGKKIIAAALAVATALTTLSFSAFATDPVGTNSITLKDGEQVTAQIAYDSSKNYDNGHNYKDFKFTVPADGTMVITLDAAISTTIVEIYNDYNKKEVSYDCNVATGHKNGFTGGWVWSDTAGVFSGEFTCKVTKGDYIIRVSRAFFSFTDTSGKDGNGRIHITAKMQKPDAPSDIQVTDKTDTTVSFSWIEQTEATSYDLRYKASGASKWTTVTDIEGNKVTIKKLTGATKYTYQMRTHAGDIVGEWSKSATVKTTDPKNVTFAVPKVS